MQEPNQTSAALLKPSTAQPAPLPGAKPASGLSPLTKLAIAAFLCFLFMCGEIVGGILANSIAILTDAAHLSSDLLGFGFSISAIIIAKRPSNLRASFGYHRSEVIGATSSLLVLWVLTAWLVIEAVHRFIHPQEVDGFIMLITSTAGLIINIVIGSVLYTAPEVVEDPAYSLSKSSELGDILDPKDPENLYREGHNTKNINVRAAFIHVLGDLIQSAGVILASIIIFVKPEWKQADPICTFFFALLVLCTSLPVMAECISILMERTPAELDTDEIVKDLQKVAGVRGIHDLHVWLLSPGKPSFSCHILSDNPNVTLVKASRIIKKKFGIAHTTIQVELWSENQPKLDCTSNLHQI